MICFVTSPSGNRLVRAKSNKAAVDFVVAETVKSRSVGADELVDLMKVMTVEEATSEDDTIVESDAEAGNAQR